MLRTTRTASSNKRGRQGKQLIVGQALVTGAQGEDRNADEIQHDGRDVHHVVGPVAPAGEESVEVAEDFLGPQIDAAFARDSGAPVR